MFADFGIDAQLSAHADIVVEIVPGQPGEYDFSCGMGMLRGRLIVAPTA